MNKKHVYQVKKVNGEVIPEYTFQKSLNYEVEVNKTYFPMKRKVDFLAATILFIITLPIMVIFSILIMLETKGSPLYTQTRVGKMGKMFKIYKLRSMHQNAESDGAKWAEENDPRITKIGRIIRKKRIDELPQLINVIKGEMSFIGPRPERPEFVELFSSGIKGFEKRCLVKPGLSGLAQVQGGYDLSPNQKLKLDMYYINNASIKLELFIITKTVFVILTGSGSR
ncbi:sugar transferase [Mammaliicoccus stepanovicii]|uniref:Putative sugar transferase n=1 Tax=Mammaliicoccus stepanovicii TaxID=643214 RepID=A0A240A4A2_9STAP|nr:UDP-phosphate N-acetylgalactosaminyl-1-phosphate transferase [Mammaliicoccus stepanovicii]GGI39509.1 UDP-phosphate N-acetylgalactosaminyl-1-phosphate transferase [Mammaliicoccus stepanovicii]SNV78272.1 putative sugar transferase [Mammaliicoccus stepanovicii]